jgi:protein SCO1/2
VTLTALGLAYVYDRDPKALSFLTGQDFTPAPPVGYKTPLISSLGTTTPLETFKGRWLVVAFGFVSCPDICPVHMAYMTKELRALESSPMSSKRDKPFLGIFVSVDPKRDSIAALEAFRQLYDSDQNNLVALTGTEEQLREVARSYGAFFEYHQIPEKSPEGRPSTNVPYEVHHSTGFYVIDPEGRLATVVSMPAVQGVLSQKLGRLM